MTVSTSTCQVCIKCSSHISLSDTLIFHGVMKVFWIPVAFPQSTLILMGSEEHRFWVMKVSWISAAFSLQHFLKEHYFNMDRGCFEYLKHFTIEHRHSWGYNGVLITWSISPSLSVPLSPSADTSPPSPVPSALDSLFTTPQFTQDSLRGDWHVAQTPWTEEAPVTLS